MKTEITTSEPVPIRKARSVKEIATKFHSQPITITTEVKLQSQEMVFTEFSAEFLIFLNFSKLRYIFAKLTDDWCCWRQGVDDFILVTVFGYCWHNLDLSDIFGMFCPKRFLKSRAPSVTKIIVAHYVSKIRHPHLSQTLVINSRHQYRG